MAQIGEILSAGRALEAAGDWDEALRVYAEGLEQFAAQDTIAVADILRKIGLVHFHRGFFESALEYFRKSLTIADALGADVQVAAAKNCQAVVHQALGQLDLAESLYHTAQELARINGDPALVVMIDQNLGTIASIRGDTSAAIKHYESARQWYETKQDDLGAARTFNNIGIAHLSAQNFDAAEKAFDAAMMHADRAQDAETLGTVHLNRADLYIRRDRYDAARACCDQAFEIFSRLGSTSGLGEAYKAYGLLYRQSGKLHLAEAHLAAVAEIAQGADNPLLEAEAERERALVHLEQGRKSDALRSLNRAHRLFNKLKASRELVDVDQQLDTLEESYLRVVQVWGESIEGRDGYTAGHCARVAEYTVMLATEVGYAGRELVWLRMGAFLHDVGKTRLPSELLTKPANLNEEEWARMRQHTIAGDEIVAELDFPYDLRPMVRSHHERWDGTGYPDGLKGNDIPLVARILSIADMYDAMTTDRSYRAGNTHEDALRMMEQQAGQMLDPELLAIFVKLMNKTSQQERESAIRPINSH